MKLNSALLKDISDDIDFCFKLAKEESVILLPGIVNKSLKCYSRICLIEHGVYEEKTDLTHIKNIVRVFVKHTLIFLWQ